jgi:hypothetical protein
MIDKISRITRISMEKNDHEQTKEDDEKKQPQKFENLLEQAVIDLLEDNRKV